MMDKNNSWGDVKITFAGKEITGIGELKYKEPVVENYYNEIAKRAEILMLNMPLNLSSTEARMYGQLTEQLEYTGRIAFSKKVIRKLLKLCNAKKFRLPRKQKKVLKKNPE